LDIFKAVKARKRKKMRLDLEKINLGFEKSSPLEIVRWAIQTFAPGIAATSSFGPESGVLLSLIGKTDPQTPVLFLETGFHFPETLEYKKQLTDLFGLKSAVDLRADPARRAKLIEDYQGKPYEANPDLCCQINKVEPLDAALKGYRGIRRHQTDHRKSIRIVEEYEGGVYKISPLANMTSRDTWWYLKENQIPIHPLYEKGYMSIGCWPCTRPIQDGDDERSGRWAGKAKKECGIHTFKEVKADKEEPETPKETGEGI
jgi:phosphoadenosine phosphosulfate reductase